MSEWKKPEFVELRMDAEINCYSSAIKQSGGIDASPKPIARESARPQSLQESSPS